MLAAIVRALALTAADIDRNQTTGLAYTDVLNDRGFRTNTRLDWASQYFCELPSTSRA
jgi:hypothetical protein